MHTVLFAAYLLGTQPAPPASSAPGATGSVERFASISYSGVDGTQWPEKRITLPAGNRSIGVAYVELNPEARKTLVFVHGLGSYLKSWRYQLDHFANSGYRVLALDLPGFGKSDKPNDYTYAMAAQARVVRGFIKKLAPKDTTLVGHSMGGHIGLLYAIAHSVELDGLVLISPAGLEKFSKKDAAWLKKAFTKPVILASTEESIRQTVAGFNFSRWRDEYAWLLTERLVVMGDPEFDAYAAANVRSVHGLLDTAPTRGGLDKIKTRVLIVYGTKDKLIPHPVLHPGPIAPLMEGAAAKIANAKTVALDGCGHMAQMDCSEGVNQALARFLEGR